MLNKWLKCPPPYPTGWGKTKLFPCPLPLSRVWGWSIVELSPANGGTAPSSMHENPVPTEQGTTPPTVRNPTNDLMA